MSFRPTPGEIRLYSLLALCRYFCGCAAAGLLPERGKQALGCQSQEDHGESRQRCGDGELAGQAQRYRWDRIRTRVSV